ncbi:MAG: nickel-dependent hydrogenase large subunit [Desulfuromonas sp.]|nr:MAG: nickel-dependent hydrogenase large subunit [Desulfuromonas sp.]
MGKVTIDPVTRVEGHLRVSTETKGGTIHQARVAGEMYRGFEQILAGRDPLDAPVITQRICGVCPVSHAIASSRCVENALELPPPLSGKLLRNLILGANFLQSHILHFYQLSALDFLNIEGILSLKTRDPQLQELKGWVVQELDSNRILPAAPFLPRLKGDYPADLSWTQNLLSHYLQALDMRRKAHSMIALLGWKVPHVASIVPGGVTCTPTYGELEAFRGHLYILRRFIESVYLPDVMATAKQFPDYTRLGTGLRRFLAFGAFPEAEGDWLPSGTVDSRSFSSLREGEIREETAYSWYVDAPEQETSLPDPEKEGAYSWIKAPRYGGKACEVGPLARLIVAYHAGQPSVKEMVDDCMNRLRLNHSALKSVFGRHLARALEAQLLARRMEVWLDQIDPETSHVAEYVPRSQGSGSGLIEAPRGALGHWITIAEGRIATYQCMVPSTWNFSPMGGRKDPGPVESALLGTPVARDSQGLEAARVVRSFDPCIACAVH